MEIFDWKSLDEPKREALLARPAVGAGEGIESAVADIIDAVRRRGDDALRDYTREFDRVDPGEFRVAESEFAAARERLDAKQVEALQTAIDNVQRFHELQLPRRLAVETAPGVLCERLVRPLEAVGLYVPAGSAPLPSTVIMLAIPARVAGCARRVLCTPPNRAGEADPAVLVAARMCGIGDVFKLGGAQAIAALAFGTETVPKVDKIFGPGNAWVTAAKMAVARMPGGAALDMPAGPSEVLVIADDTARAEFVAADLLSQAEHGADSQVILVTTEPDLGDGVREEVERQLDTLSRAGLARQALGTSRILVVADLDEAFAVSNRYAPEHLILQVARPRDWLDAVLHAGSVFLGPWTPESMGDYCSGTNHVLPTYGYARSVGGLGVDAFVRQMTVQELTPGGLQELGPVAHRLATMEGLDAHAQAVARRLASLREGADT